jgi:hypothetical protein
MDANPQLSGSFWQRRRKILLIAGIGAAALCIAACLYAILFSSGVTPIRAQLAQQAISNPASATLHLGQYGDISRWVSAGGNDFAVNNGMVIFPEANNVTALVDYVGMRDLKRPALVYAPNGGDLTTLPGMPDNQPWLYGTEWRLLNCQPEGSHPLWWRCLLVVGSGI